MKTTHQKSAVAGEYPKPTSENFTQLPGGQEQLKSSLNSSVLPQQMLLQYIMLYCMPLIFVQLLVSIFSILPRCPFHQGFPTQSSPATVSNLSEGPLPGPVGSGWLETLANFPLKQHMEKKKLQDQNQHQNNKNTKRDWMMMMMMTTTTTTMTMTMNTNIVRWWWSW